LPLQTAEKDIHITDLLSRLSTLQVRHTFFKGLNRGEVDRVDDGIRLIFSGGTCLSKAHGIINRMSEDIDIKVSLQPPTTGEFKKDFGHRGRLKALHASVEKLLAEMDFEVPDALGDKTNPVILNIHRHYEIGSRYSSKAPPIISLRPELKLEIVHREPRLPTTAIKFGYLYERLAGGDLKSPLTIECIQISETIAEKVVSLLRRCAWKWDGFQKGEMDDALVRHVYDIYRIMQVEPDALTGAKEIFASIVQGDADEYGAQHPSFVADPKGPLQRTLTAAKENSELRNSYTTRLLPLIYEGHLVTFDEAFSEFEKVASVLLDTLEG
jgi:hypothetical protein